MSELSPKLKKALDELVQRRMANTGETQSEAREHVAKYLQQLIGN